MRTTLNLDDDVYELAKSLAEGQRISLGEAVSYLARRGAMAQPVFAVEDGFPVFQIGPDVAPFGPKDIEAALDMEDRESVSQFLNLQR